jgi:hypothetical protein
MFDHSEASHVFVKTSYVEAEAEAEAPEAEAPEAVAFW